MLSSLCRWVAVLIKSKLTVRSASHPQPHALLLATVTLVLSQAVFAEGMWRTSWGISLQQGTDQAVEVSDQTLRIPLKLSAGGDALRVRISNEFGDEEMRIGAASVRLPDGSIVPLQFNGAGATRVAPRSIIVTDPVAHKIGAAADVEVRLYFPERTRLTTFKRLSAAQGTDISAAGNHTSTADFPISQSTYPVFLRAVEVAADAATPGLVILSDTKSAAPDTWVPMYADTVAGNIAVTNRSVFAGRMFFGNDGTSALARFDTDVAATTGATHLLLFVGNNDLIQPGMRGSNGRVMLPPEIALSADEIIAQLHQLAVRAKALGLKVIAATWLPYAAATPDGYAAPHKLEARDRINAWLRTADIFDAVVDFDAALKDPTDPSFLDKRYDSGNGFTPSPAGYARMAEVMAALKLP
ncbi:MAG: hypothetical protein H6978_10645 [Gammaproteobacteria bacterium]|nr:hypothetical protein [Gammaproteobacteria bacterium]